jgi:hypothetical protein
MNNELLGYIKEAIYSVAGFLILMDWLNMSDQQLGGLILAVAAVGTLALRINSIRSGGAVQTLRNKAIAAEEAGIVTSEGPPPTTP